MTPAAALARSLVLALSLALAAFARADQQTSQPQRADRPYTFYWCVSGPHAAGLAPETLGVRTDCIMVYQQDFGLYPRFHEGAKFHGGVPQAADLPAHLAKLTLDIDKFIPDRAFAGYVVIDYEGWDPLWEVSRDEYKNLSRQLVRQRNPQRSERDIERLAKAGFESAARTFLLETLRVCRAARPNAKWGYYGIPWPHHNLPDGKLDWLYKASDALFPCCYMFNKTAPAGQKPGPGEATKDFYENHLRNTVGVARALGGPDKPVIALIWIRYDVMNKTHGLKLLDPADLDRSLAEPRLHGASGAAFWDVLLKPEDAAEYRQYLAATLRPALARFRQEP
ncbi:MAG: hypothetical protein SFZ24_12790 [Planctomycetota bacterium]|nr:hypothetical protein [Planctomycetota bacterium]